MAAAGRSGLTLTKWCEKHGLNPRLIYRWRQGDVGNPQVRSVQALAEALGIDFDDALSVVMAAAKD